MGKSQSEKLIEELISNPIHFAEKGKSYNLLREYFQGFPVKTLRPLLIHEDRNIQRQAVWIVSELGEIGRNLIYDIIPFLNDGERAIRYEALESVMIFSASDYYGEFLHVVKNMESEDEVIRVLAMYLVSNANNNQLQSAIQRLKTFNSNDEIHKIGLTFLLKEDTSNVKRILEMINNENSLIRKYGAIAAKKISQKQPEIIKLAHLSKDPDITQFAQDVIDLEFDDVESVLE